MAKQIGNVWIFPCNTNVYDCTKAFNDLIRVDWHQNKLMDKIAANDIVYIYSSVPIKAITHQCIVNKTNIPSLEIADFDYYVDRQRASEKGPFVELQCIREFDALEGLSIDKLRLHGIKGNIQGPQKIPENLIQYLESIVEEQSALDRMSGKNKKFVGAWLERTEKSEDKEIVVGELSTDSSMLISNKTFYYDEERFDTAVKLLLDYLRTHKDQNRRPIDFECGYLKEEHYKYDVYKNAKKALNFSSWTTEMIGSGKILDCVLEALKLGGNLIDYHTNGFKEAADKHMKRAEQAFYDLYVNSLNEAPFREITDIFGKNYSRTAFLYFLKDKDKFLPIKPEYFKQKFRLMGIHSDCTYGLTWDHYMEFISIIADVQKRLCDVYRVKGTLLDAHSFVWAICLIENEMLSYDDQFEDYSEGIVQISQAQWEAVLQNQDVVTESIKQVLARIYYAPEHAITCKELGEQAHVHPSAFISPVTSFGKSVSKELHVPQLNNNRGGERFWAIPFLGRYLANNLFVWKMRPELVAAFEKVCSDALEDMQETREKEEAVSLSSDALYEQVKDYGTDGAVMRKVRASKQFKRNQKVAEWARRRADDDACLLCNQVLDFNDKEGRPYLEVHHVVPLSEGGMDNIYNVVALCPNCHKKMHLANNPEDRDFLLDCLNSFKQRGE